MIPGQMYHYKPCLLFELGSRVIRFQHQIPIPIKNVKQNGVDVLTRLTLE